jgi:hypothetical protein
MDAPEDLIDQVTKFTLLAIISHPGAQLVQVGEDQLDEFFEL